MKIESILRLIGIVIFIIVTSQTYYIVTPLNKTSNASLEAVTNKVTNTTTNMIADTKTNTTNTTTGTTVDISLLTNNYRIITSIMAGLVIAIVMLYFIRTLVK